jgi:oligopeptide/dipeptide ABC transporter ATP-binding protein
MSSALLEVRDLAVQFEVRAGSSLGGRKAILRAVDGVSFEIPRGGALGLVGESGSGKTTVARCVAGLTRATSGSIRLDGAELARAGRRAWRPHRSRVQIVFQDPYASLDPRQTIASILSEPLAIDGRLPRRERTLRMLGFLEAVGLDVRLLQRYPHELSGGQRQRVAIARALLVEPDLLVCDEPTSALDVSVRAQVLNLLADLERRIGLAMLVISHDLATVRHLCDTIAVMYLGRIVEIGATDEVLRSPRHPYTRALLSAVPTLERSAARERIVLGGEIASPIAPPPGCAFHPRCPERARVPGDRCARETPELRERAGRVCACHLDG